MPTFEIPDGPTSVDLKRSPDGSATGSVVFNVTSKSSDAMSGRLSVVPSGGSQEGWFAIDGDRERNFAAGETQTAKITVTAPKDVATGEYPFKLRAVAVNDPDNDHAEGPVATAKVPPPPPPKPPSRWWLWVIIALVVLAVLGVGGYFLAKVLSGDGKKDHNPTGNTVTADDGKVPDFTTNPMTIEQARAAAGGYDIVEEAGEATGKAPRTVIKQNPKPGTKLAKGSLVKLTFDPGVEVPALPGGATFASAPNTLKSAKLQPGQFLCDRELSGQPAQVGRVTAFSPASGTRVAANSEVNMIAVQPAACPRIIIIRPDIFLRTDAAKTLTVTQRTNFLRSINTR